jgi:hypothetical protein
MKTGLDALVTAEKESGRAILKNGSRQPRYCQNMKTTADVVDSAEKESWHSKLETGPDALDTVKNESGNANHENGTKRTRHRKKHVRERKP